MNPVPRQLVLCCREQWMGGLFHHIRPWGDGLGLDASRHAAGLYCLPAVDSGENGFDWGRVVIDAELPPDTALRVYARASDHRGWGGWTDLDEGIRALEGDPGPALRDIFGPPAAESGDLILRASGRYLWLMVELAAAGKGSPVIRSIRIRMGGDHMTDYLPAIYQEDDFTRRFLSIFDSMLLDLEDQIADLPRRMDYENTDPETLAYLASWVCVEEGGSPQALRERIAGALADYEGRYTVEGVSRSVRRLTGREPMIVEHFTVSPNRPDCRNPELYRRLYGENPHRFFVLLEEGAFSSRQELERFQRKMDALIPAGVSMELVLLKQCVQLDWHTYLGVNSRVGGYQPAALDERTTIHYDTTIGGVHHES